MNHDSICVGSQHQQSSEERRQKNIPKQASNYGVFLRVGGQFLLPYPDNPGAGGGGGDWARGEWLQAGSSSSCRQA